MFTIDKQKFGAFVAQLRKERGMTQREVAEHLHLSDKAVSKWETGMSIPDTALLVPLAELLGVTVTELLLCRRQEKGAVMEQKDVEDVVKSAIAYPSGPPRRVWQCNGRWTLWYFLALLVGGAGLLLLYRLHAPLSAAWPPVLLGAVFGAWFCFFALSELPQFYDEHPIRGLVDGPFRMNVPGLHFNNRNWPHIMTTGRIWSCATMPGAPLLCLILWRLWPEWCPQLQQGVVAVAMLAGLFLPVYLTGKQFE